jgi:hypothetical protein
VIEIVVRRDDLAAQHVGPQRLWRRWPAPARALDVLAQGGKLLENQDHSISTPPFTSRQAPVM